MYVCLCVHTRAYVCVEYDVCVGVCAHMSCVCVEQDVCVCPCVYVCVCVVECMCVHVYTRACVCLEQDVCVCAHVPMRVWSRVHVYVCLCESRAG